MAIEHRNETILLSRGEVHLTRVDVYQTGYGRDTFLTRRYLVRNEDVMIQAATVERAEEILTEIENGTRKLELADE